MHRPRHSNDPAGPTAGPAMDRRGFMTAAGAAGAALFAGTLPTGRTAADPTAPPAPTAATPAVQRESLRDVSVLITGCSTGFGRLAAASFAGQGAAVIASMRDLNGKNAEHARSLKALNAEHPIRVVEIDVNDDASVERGVDQALKLTNRIDILINNAGIVSPGPVGLSLDSIRREFETNVFGCVRTMRAVLPGMESRGSGLIVHVSSTLGRFVLPTAGGYCGSKFAMEAIMEAATYELHPLGIEVAIVQPGEYDTQFKENGRRYMAEARAAWDAGHKARAVRYAEHLKVLDAAMQDRETPPAQDVVDAIVDLARTPRGQRPMRVPTAPNPQIQAGAEQINAGLAQAQLGLLQAVGVPHWATLR